VPYQAAHNQFRRSATVLISRFIAVLSIVFVLELAFDYLLPFVLPDASTMVKVLADSVILLMFCVPSFWWLIYRPLRVAPLVLEAQLQLQQSEDRFRTIFEQSEDAIILFSPGTCKIVDVNETTEKLYGYRSGALHRPFNHFGTSGRN
jgi:PAS domain-containing protein